MIITLSIPLCFQPSADKVKEVTSFSKDCLEKIERARVDMDYHQVNPTASVLYSFLSPLLSQQELFSFFQQVVKLCHECLEKQKDVLADTHLYKLRVLSVLSEVLSYQQKFSEAANYAHKMVGGYMKLYHPNNAQLGMAIMRAGVTHWHAGLIEEGHVLICKAYGILMVTHGPNHAITKDLESMRTQTEVELKMFKESKDAYHSMRDAALKSPLADEKAKGV